MEPIRIGTGNIKVGSAIAHGTGKKYEMYDTSKSEPMGTAQAIPPQPVQGESSFVNKSVLQERNKFEQFLLQKYNVPISIGRKEINQETVKRAAEFERELFEGTFGGQFRYEDRNSLPLQLKAAWGHAKLSAKKQIQDQLIAGVQKQISAHKERMKVFDTQLSKLPTGYALWEQDPEKYKQFKGADRQGAGLTPYQELALEKDLVGIEKSILNDAKTINEENVADLQLSVDFFNEHADKNYKYMISPEYGATWSGKETVTYKLKRIPKPKKSKAKEIKPKDKGTQTMTDEEIADILRGKYEITPENIRIFRENNGI